MRRRIGELEEFAWLGGCHRLPLERFALVICPRFDEIGHWYQHFCFSCEFRHKLDSDSSRSWTVIPRQAGQ
jgi:hypothetical protein